MKERIRKKWIRALRSGRYRKTKGILRNKGLGRYCCLGVLTDLYSKEKKKDWDEIKFFENYSFLPVEVQEWAGLKCEDVIVADGTETLSGLNDNGLSFKRIADIIAGKDKEYTCDL